MASLPSRSAATRLAKIALCWLALVFALQLIASTQHRHDLASASPDCPSCLIACHAPGNLPGAGMALAADAAASLIYHLFPAPRYAYHGAPSFLIPHAHAPPAFLAPA